MTRRRLRIAFSACYFHRDPQRAIFKGKTLLYLEQSIAHWVLARGALAYLVPSLPAGAPYGFDEMVKDFDGLVLQGGSDVSPKHYGEEPLKPEWAGDYVRDLHEIELLRQFRKAGKPVLGICRGAQLINVALGGSMVQDIATQLPGAADHRNWDIYDHNFHEIAFEPGSEIARLYPGTTTAKVNSIHHQALKRIGEGLVVEARAPDGTVEAIRTADSLVYAVQWHPEFMDPPDGLAAQGEPGLLDCQPILTQFLKRCESSKRE